MKKLQLNKIIFLLAFLSFFVILSHSCYAIDCFVTLTKLRHITECDPPLNVSERVKKCIDLLKTEITNPSDPIIGIGGGPIDTTMIRYIIAGSVCTFAQRGKMQLEIRDEIKKNILIADPKDLVIHKYFLFMLAATGDGNVKDELMSIIKSDVDNCMRINAVCSLRDIDTYLNDEDISLLQTEFLKENNFANILFSDSFHSYKKGYMICSSMKTNIAMILGMKKSNTS